MLFILRAYWLLSGHTVPALRGKDYGKTKMRYPDYIETESGLQYKVTCQKLCFLNPLMNLLPPQALPI